MLRGPNYWAREPVVRMLVDLGVLEHFPSNTLPGFTDALVGLLPSLEDHACSLGRRGGFISRLRDGTWVGHVAEHVALELQNLAGTDVRHGKTRGAGPVGHYNVIYEYREESVGIEAGKIAVAPRQPPRRPDDAAPEFDLLAELERLIRLAERSAFGPSTQALIDEAVSRDIPYIRLDRHSPRPARPGRPPAADPGDDDVADVRDRRRHRVRQEPHQPPPGLGRACRSRAPRWWTPRTPRSRPRRGSASRAWSSRSTATTAGACTSTSSREEAVRAAFPGALRESRAGDVVVETYVTRQRLSRPRHRGSLAAVAERVPASVVGDGEHTVRELVDTANADPRRGIGHEKVLTRIALDEAAEALLGTQGLDLTPSRPAASGSSSP